MMITDATLQFPGKTLLLFVVNRSPDDAIVLQNVRMDVIGGRQFVAGEFAEGTTANDWASGVPTAVAWDCVEQYMVFDSLEDYFARAAKAYNEMPQMH